MWSSPLGLVFFLLNPSATTDRYVGFGCCRLLAAPSQRVRSCIVVEPVENLFVFPALGRLFIGVNGRNKSVFSFDAQVLGDIVLL